MSDPVVESLLQRVARGEVTPERAAAELSALTAGFPQPVEVAGVRVDLDRAQRCGYPEVVYGPGKPLGVILEVFARQAAAGQCSLATRLNPEQIEGVRQACPLAVINLVSRTARVDNGTELPRGRVVVATAGTSDRPVAEEALETLRWMNCEVELIQDVGVAGPHRLLGEVPRLRQAQAIVVAAGMEAALASAVAGWVSCPVIAVPTSVGYGASFGGVTALLGMLASCAANVAVVNIDAGFKAGFLAGLVARGTAGRAPE